MKPGFYYYSQLRHPAFVICCSVNLLTSDDDGGGGDDDGDGDDDGGGDDGDGDDGDVTTDEGAYVDTAGHVTRNSVLQWGEMPTSVGMYQHQSSASLHSILSMLLYLNKAWFPVPELTGDRCGPSIRAVLTARQLG